MRITKSVACRLLAGAVLTAGITLTTLGHAEARPAGGHAPGGALLDRMSSLASRTAALDRRERHLANELDWFASHGRVQRAEGVADRLQTLSERTERLTRRDSQLAHRFDALLDTQTVGRNMQRKADTIQDEMNRNRVLNRDVEHLANRVDFQLSHGVDNARAEATADRLQHLTVKDFRFAKTEHRMTDRLDSRLDPM